MQDAGCTHGIRTFLCRLDNIIRARNSARRNHGKRRCLTHRGNQLMIHALLPPFRVHGGDEYLPRTPALCLANPFQRILAGALPPIVKVGFPARFPALGLYAQHHTLASVRRMFASVDVAALAAGTVRVPSLVLDRPRIFAKNYADGRKNWDVFIAGGSKGKDPADSLAEKEPMKFALGRIVLRGHPHVVYSSPADTLFAMADFSRMRFNGRLAAGDDELVRPDAADMKARRRYTRDSIRRERRKRRSRIGLTVDSMLVAGRLPSDTLALRLDRLGARAHAGHVDLDASATAWLASANYGRIGLPVDISAEVGFPKDSVFALDIIDLKASVADIPLKASADLRFGDRLRMSGGLSVDDCRLNDVLKYFRRSSFDLARNLDTDARISLTAEFDGFLDPSGGVFPDIDAHLLIPRSSIGNRMFDLRHEIALDGELHGRVVRYLRDVVARHPFRLVGQDVLPRRVVQEHPVLLQRPRPERVSPLLGLLEDPAPGIDEGREGRVVDEQAVVLPH